MLLALLVIVLHIVIAVELGGADHRVPFGAGRVFYDAGVQVEDVGPTILGNS